MFPLILPEKDMSGAVEDVFVFVFLFFVDVFSYLTRGGYEWCSGLCFFCIVFC